MKVKHYIYSALSLSLLSLISCKTQVASSTKSIIGNNNWTNISTSEIAKKFAANVLNLQIDGNSVGTGFVIFPGKKLLITNAHVALAMKYCPDFSANCKTYTASNESNKLRLKKIFLLDKALDVSLIEYEIVEENIKFIPLEFGNWTDTSEVMYVGLENNKHVVGQGKITGEDTLRADKPSFFHDMNTLQGMSGSPIVSTNGKLVGIHWGSHESNVFNQAIPIALVAEKYPDLFGNIAGEKIKKSYIPTGKFEDTSTKDELNNFKYQACNANGLIGKLDNKNNCIVIVSTEKLKEITQNPKVVYNKSGIAQNDKQIYIDSNLMYILNANNEGIFDYISTRGGNAAGKIIEQNEGALKEIVKKAARETLPTVDDWTIIALKSVAAGAVITLGVSYLYFEYKTTREIRMLRYREENAALNLVNTKEELGKTNAEKVLAELTKEREAAEAKSLSMSQTVLEIIDGKAIRKELNSVGTNDSKVLFNWAFE